MNIPKTILRLNDNKCIGKFSYKINKITIKTLSDYDNIFSFNNRELSIIRLFEGDKTEKKVIDFLTKKYRFNESFIFELCENGKKLNVKVFNLEIEPLTGNVIFKLRNI